MASGETYGLDDLVERTGRPIPDLLAELAKLEIAGKVARMAGGGFVLRVQSSVRLGEFDEPQPDIALLRPPLSTYRERHPTAADVLLLIEVADSSLAYDRGTKLPLYVRHGIPEVWLVDLAARAVEVHTDPIDGAFTRTHRVTEGRLSIYNREPPKLPKE